MGQSFTGLILDRIKDDKGLEKELYLYGVSSYAPKLTEHSFIYNDILVSAYVYLTKTKDAHVWWVGDNVSEGDFKSYEPIRDILAVIKDYPMHSVNKQSFVESDNRLSKIKLNRLYKQEYPYLLNHTKKEYINMRKYIENCMSEDGWCIHPLSLLTAVGNDYGSGGYKGINKEFVGSWAGDNIRIYQSRPKNCKSITDKVIFKEV